MRGTIHAISHKRLEAGSFALIKIDNVFCGLVTILHLDVNHNPFVSGPCYNGIISEVTNTSLYELVVKEDGTDIEYPLHSKFWNSASQLKQIGSSVTIEFDVKDHPFEEGLYQKICFLCESHFTGHKRQRICENCCKEFRTAHIITINDKFEKKPNFIPFSTVYKIAKNAFLLDKDVDFDKWFNERI